MQKLTGKVALVTGAGRGNADQTNYSAAKAAIVGLTKSLAKEWGRYNGNVNAVAFGFIETRLTAAAGAVVMLCYPEANYVSGQIIEVTGGW